MLYCYIRYICFAVLFLVAGTGKSLGHQRPVRCGPVLPRPVRTARAVLPVRPVRCGPLRPLMCGPCVADPWCPRGVISESYTIFFFICLYLICL